MYNTSKLYKEKILENNRVFKLDIRIEHSKGTLKLTDKDIAQNTLVFEDATQSGDEFTVGGTFASNIDFTLVNKSEYENISFTGAKVYVNIGLLVREAIDAHFIQPTQPSKMVDFDDLWEYVPLGEFNIDDVNRLRSTIEIRAIDNMILLDKSYEHSKLAYPATLKEIFLDICQMADVTPGTTSFVNDNYVVDNIPEKEGLSFRNVLGFLSEIAGSYASFNRDGHLELRWYEETDLVLTPDQRSSFEDKDYEVKITGVQVIEEIEYEVTSEESERIVKNISDEFTSLKNSKKSIEYTLSEIEDRFEIINTNGEVSSEDEVALNKSSSRLDKKMYELELHFNLIMAQSDVSANLGSKASDTFKLVDAHHEDIVLQVEDVLSGNLINDSIYDSLKVKISEFKNTLHQFEGSVSELSNDIIKKISESGRTTESETITHLAGTDEYAIDLTDNELIKYNVDKLLSNILDRIGGVKFIPTEAEFNGNPAIESGDIITHEDIDGNIINTVVTHSSYKYRGRHTIKGEGKHNLSRDFKSTDNRIAHIIDRVEENLGDEINNLEQAQLNATELIANTLGGFITEIRVEADPDYDRFGIGKFVHDAPQLRDSTKIWKWGLGGFGYSDDGGETYTTAITKDGSIVANLITANMVQTGVLRSLNNKTVMDLDNGTFRLGNEMIFDGQTLNMGGNTSISWGNISDQPSIPDDKYITTISRNAITTEFLRSKKLTVGDEIIMGPNAIISWDNVTGTSDVANKSDIPTKASDIGAHDSGWRPTWSQVSGKPRVYSRSEIESYATTITKNTITTPFINALDITAKHLESGTIRIGGRNNDAFRVSTTGTLYGANGNFKVAHDGDGVYNSYANTSSSSDTSPAAARWKRSDGNYFYQDLNEARIYMGGRSRFRLRERDGISNNWALTLGGSDGATIKAIDDAIQIRNYTDARYAPISASDFKLADGTSIVKTYSLLGQPATISSDKLDVIKNTKIYEEPQNIIDNDKKITLLNHSENMDMKFANIPKEISNNGEISMMNTIGVLWKAVQELSAEVDELKGVK